MDRLCVPHVLERRHEEVVDCGATSFGGAVDFSLGGNPGLVETIDVAIVSDVK